MYTNLTVVISTRSDNQNFDSFINHINKTIGINNFNLIFYKNDNEFSLSELYNKGIAESNTDIIVFIHDDIEFLTKNWGKLLLKHFNTTDFGILGVAGSTEIKKDGIWWSDQRKLAGNVYHKQKNKKYLSSYSNNFGNNIIETINVDGLFIAIDKNRIKRQFNEEYNGFHYYDLGFCVENHNLGVKIGVISNINILHESIGELKNDFHYKRSNFLFINDKILPKKSDISLIIDNNKNIKIKNKPKTTIIIPHKDNNLILYKLLDSIYRYDNYNIDIIIADTGSTEKNKNELKKFLKYNNFIKIIEYNYYNFAKINNDVVKNYVSDETEVLIFCNNDIELINDCINNMINLYVKNKNTVGTIGARLHFEDNSIQHNGIICKNHNNSYYFTHDKYKYSYSYNNNQKNDIIGNTGALMLTPKKIFNKIGGFNENYIECFEDVEYNLSCILNGRKNIFCGYAVAYHKESLTRNLDINKNNNEIIDNSKLLSFFKENIGTFGKYVIN